MARRLATLILFAGILASSSFGAIAPILNRYAEQLSSVGFLKVSNDGKWIAASENTNATMYVRVFDAVTGKLMWVQSTKTGMAFYPDSQFILSGWRKYDVSTGEIVTVFGRNSIEYKDFQFTPNGKFLLGDGFFVLETTDMTVADSYDLWNDTAYGQPMVDRHGIFILAPSKINNVRGYCYYAGLDPKQQADAFPQRIPILENAPCIPNPDENSFVHGVTSLKKFSIPNMAQIWQSSTNNFRGYTYTQNNSTIFAVTTTNYQWISESTGAIVGATLTVQTNSATRTCDSPLTNSVFVGTNDIRGVSNLTRSVSTTLAPHSVLASYLAANPLSRRTYQRGENAVDEVDLDQHKITRSFSLPGTGTRSVESITVDGQNNLFVLFRQITPNLKKIAKFNLTTGLLVATSSVDIPGSTLKVSASGQIVLTFENGLLHIFDPITLNLLNTKALISSNGVTNVDISPSESLVITNQSGKLFAFAASNWIELWSADLGTNDFGMAVIDSDEDVVLVSRNNGTVRVLSATTGTNVGTIPIQSTFAKLMRLPGNGGVYAVNQWLEKIENSTMSTSNVLQMSSEIVSPLGYIPLSASTFLVFWDAGIYEVSTIL